MRTELNKISRQCYKWNLDDRTLLMKLDIAPSTVSTPSSTRAIEKDGHKFSVVRRLNLRNLRRPVEKRNIYLARLHWSPLWWSHRNFFKMFKIRKLESLSYLRRCLCDDIFSHFTARLYASEVYAVVVCPSVRLSQAGTVPKRRNIGSRMVALGF